MSVQHQRMVTSYLECILHKNNGQIKRIFESYNGVHEVDFYNIWSEPGSKKGPTKSLFIFYSNWVTSFYILPAGITLYYLLMKMKYRAHLKYHDAQLCQKLCKLVRLFECSGLTWFCKWKTELLILSLGGATGVINLFNIELTDVFRTIQRRSVPKITQIGLDIDSQT